MLPTAGVGGLLTLTSSVMALPVALLAVLSMWRLERSAALRLGALFAVAGILFLLPWGYRNHLELGKWIFTRSNFGLEL